MSDEPQPQHTCPKCGSSALETWIINDLAALAAERPATDDRQEWKHDKDGGIWRDKEWIGNARDSFASGLICDSHNAALAALNSQLDDAGSHNAAADRELRELRQQLAAENERVTHILTLKMDEYRKELAAERERHEKDIGALIEGHAAKVLAKDEDVCEIRQVTAQDAAKRIHWHHVKSPSAYGQEDATRTTKIILEAFDKIDPPKRPVRIL